MLHRPLLVTALLALLAPVAAADPPPTAPGEVIVVTGLRLPRPVSDTPSTLLVLDKLALAHAPQLLADDVLRSLPSVGTFRRSSSLIADPTSQGLNLRGVGPSGVSRALVLRDGIPENDPFGGWVYWRAISPLSLARIEVAPSGASALFGDFALGGVVQVVSRPIVYQELRALLSGGSLGTGHAAMRVANRFHDLGFAFDAEAFHTGGYTPIAPAQRGAVDHAAGSDHASAALRVEHTHGASKLHATARWFSESLDAGTDHTTADVRTLSYGAGWTLSSAHGALDVDLFGGNQRFRQERARVAPDRSTAARSSQQRTPSNNQGAMATWTTTLGTRHQLVVGGDARRIEGTATDALSPVMVDAMSLVERAAGGEQRFAGVFAQDAVRLTPRLELAAALRLDAWQNRAGRRALTFGSGEHTSAALDGSSDAQLDPRLGVLYHATDVVSLRASGYRAFRAPTLNELYRPFQVGTVLTEANEHLAAERLWGVEAGPQIVVDQIVVRATGFWNRLQQPIANVTLAEPLPSGATRQRQNLGAARIAGLELDASWHPTAAWTFGIAETFIDATVREAPATPKLVGQWLAQDPRHRTTGTVTFDDRRIATVTAEVRYLGQQFEDDLNTLSMGSVILVDARIARELPGGLTVFASAQNLFDRRYLVGRAGVDTLGAPRQLELGLGYAAR